MTARAKKAVATIVPPQPPQTEKEKAASLELREMMRGMADGLQQRNLDAAVALARQAARRRGPLVDHFAELGRRFGSEIDPHEKPNLRLVKGGGRFTHPLRHPRAAGRKAKAASTAEIVKEPRPDPAGFQSEQARISSRP
ncbi:hypothetical protein [Acidisoma cladoniae]|uniref:hypothetical protein n=1 Tax=Acidisoma cladoniae TaxID=3040935 RepID=UPI00254C5E2B|nr:hypothetical protein [Acidisoma sp. PAMC 29798]